MDTGAVAKELISPLSTRKEGTVFGGFLSKWPTVKSEDANEAVVVYIDESLVHQLHGSA